MKIFIISVILIAVLVYTLLIRRCPNPQPKIRFTKSWCQHMAELEPNCDITAGSTKSLAYHPSLEPFRSHTKHCDDFEGQCICSRPPQHSIECNQFEGQCICGFERAMNKLET